MASGRGCGRAGPPRNYGGLIAGIVLLYLAAIATFITSMVLFSIANGNYDYDWEIDYDHCSWSEWYNGRSTWSSWSSWGSWQKDCETGKEKWDDWVQAKEDMRIGAIVLLVFSLLCVCCGSAFAIMLCVRCSRPNQGVVHSTQPITQTVMVGQPTVTTIQNPHVVNPVVQPVAPPTYNVATQNQAFQQSADTRPPAYNAGYQQTPEAPYSPQGYSQPTPQASYN